MGPRTASRRFSIQGVTDPRVGGRLLEARSFEDAALHFVEDHHLEGDAEDGVSLMVEDCETGERHCFRIDLATGEAGPCE